ncbi:Peptidase family M23 [Actinobaculum suis]|uniref:Peptidase family M23 n=2 Tax=Actinobaculum suis TaxID=1657 RepID=A0A7Z9C8S0_9ACTO|nr:Peptidase family M23 [Actinobaculum suis]
MAAPVQSLPDAPPRALPAALPLALRGAPLGHFPAPPGYNPPRFFGPFLPGMENESSGRRFISPSGEEPIITRGFNAPDPNWLPGHRGVDMAFVLDQPVLAAGSGTVIYAGMLVDRMVISIEHPNGIRTSYEPVEPRVKRGQRVTAGEVIGWAQAGHSDKVPEGFVAVHWGARRGSVYLDPLSLLRRREIRLY